MVFQPTPWDTAAFFYQNERQSLIPKLPDQMWLIPKTESTDHQDRIELTAYKGFQHRQPGLGPPSENQDSPLF